MSNKISVPDKVNDCAGTEATGETIGDKRVQHVKDLTKALVIAQDYDTIDVTYPSSTTERFSYKLDATEVLLLELTYTAASKNDLLKVEVL